jgi:PKHD-type hydroxylase
VNHLPIWYLGRIPEAVCDAALAEFQAIGFKDAVMGVNGDIQDHKKRNTSICFAPNDHWFGGIMLKHGLIGNEKCDWQYGVDGHEAIQFAKYEPGQHYDWHVDVFPLSGLQIERKLTVICLLSDVYDFNGGDLFLKLYQEYQAPLEKGSLIAFPSQLEHKVTPVISGVRYSATMWLNGPRGR